MAELIFESYRKTKNFIEKVIVWKVPKTAANPVGLKYSMALIYREKRILGYDHSAPEPHHRHYLGHKTPIEFESITKAYEKFIKEKNELMKKLGEKNEG